jgi:hypothetical protein
LDDTPSCGGAIAVSEWDIDQNWLTGKIQGRTKPGR